MPIKPVIPKKNPVQIPAPISAISQYPSRLPINVIWVIMAIPEHTSWIMLSPLIVFFDTSFFILSVSDWGWGEFIIIGLFGSMMRIVDINCLTKLCKERKQNIGDPCISWFQISWSLLFRDSFHHFEFFLEIFSDLNFFLDFFIYIQ